MSVRIFKPSKKVTQSGQSKTNLWVLEFDRESAPILEPLMGYTSSCDMNRQVRLFFNTSQEAIAYAQKKGLDFRLDAVKEKKYCPIRYCDNFLHDKKESWTH